MLELGLYQVKKWRQCGDGKAFTAKHFGTRSINVITHSQERQEPHPREHHGAGFGIQWNGILQ
jgi:hypothetical protein